MRSIPLTALVGVLALVGGCRGLLGIDQFGPEVDDAATGGGGGTPAAGGGTSEDGDAGGAGTSAPKGEPLWSGRLGGDQDDAAHAVAVDADGQVALVGAFFGDLSLPDGRTLSNAGGSDILLARYGADGHALGFAAFGDAAEQRALAVAFDDDGAMYLGGWFEGSVDFGGGPLSTADRDAFVAKLDDKGEHLWSVSFGGAGSDEVAALAFDPAGALVVAGVLDGPARVLGTDLNGGPDADAFVLSLEPGAAALRWAKRYGAAGEQRAEAVAADDAGVVVSGAFAQAIDFGGASLAGQSPLDAFVVALDSNGTHRWSQGFGSSAAVAQHAYGVAARDGETVVVGGYEGSIRFGSDSFGGPAGQPALYAVRFDAAGDLLWSFTAPQGTVGQLRHVALDVDGHAVVAGELAGQLDLGGGTPLSSAGGNDGLVMRLDEMGVPQWGQLFGRAAADTANGCALDGDGNTVVAGTFFEGFDLGSGAQFSAGGSDVMVAKLTR
jgi:hypothetical protein